MKKMMFVMLLIVCGFVCANAQIVVSNNTNTVKLDTNGDGIWDMEVNVQGIPNVSFISAGRNFYSELGRVYVINMWRQYQSQGVNPANYLPDPFKAGDFTAYANVYASRINFNGSGVGMVGVVPGAVGMPGNASVTVGGKNFGFSLSVPVKSNNNPYYTPNASLGVNVKGNYVGVSVPVSITKKNRNNTTTTAPTTTTTRTTTTAPTTTRRMTSTQTSRSTGMTQDEVSAMTNSAYYY